MREIIANIIIIIKEIHYYISYKLSKIKGGNTFLTVVVLDYNTLLFTDTGGAQMYMANIAL